MLWRYGYVAVFLAVSGFLLCSCQKKEDGQPETSCYQNPGEVYRIDHDGLTREYILYVPGSYHANREVPLLVMFHGFGGTAAGFMAYADMRQLADQDTFIVAYPQGSCLDGEPHWNPCPLGGDNKSRADDTGFFEAMVEDIDARYAIDRLRIYAAGFSNGAMMAYGLAGYKSHLVAAVAAVAGAMPGCAIQPSHPVPVIHLHGTNDEVIPYAGNAYYPAVDSALQYWIAFNQTRTVPVIETGPQGSLTIERLTYADGINGSTVVLVRYHGRGHEWFQDTYMGKSTGQVIWEFLSGFNLNGKI